MELLEVETMDIALWKPEIIVGAVLPAAVVALIVLAGQDGRIPAQLKQTNHSILEVVRNSDLVALSAQMCVLPVRRGVDTLCKYQLQSK